MPGTRSDVQAWTVDPSHGVPGTDTRDRRGQRGFDAPSPRRASRGCHLRQCWDPARSSTRWRCTQHCQRRHARRGRCHRPAVRFDCLTHEVPSPRGAPRGHSRPAAAVTSRHQRVAVSQPSPSPAWLAPGRELAGVDGGRARRGPRVCDGWVRGKPLGNGHVSLLTAGCHRWHARRRCRRRAAVRDGHLTPEAPCPRRAPRGCPLRQCWDLARCSTAMTVHPTLSKTAPRRRRCRRPANRVDN